MEETPRALDKSAVVIATITARLVGTVISQNRFQPLMAIFFDNVRSVAAMEAPYNIACSRGSVPIGREHCGFCERYNPRMHKIRQAVKWTVYTLLIVNFVFYILEDWDRATHILDEGSSLLEWTSEFATSIDETAWFVLLFMFELETYALSDKAWKGWVEHTVRGVRLFCFVMIAHTIYAFAVEVIDLTPTIPVAGVSDLCTMTDSNVSYVFNLEYTSITDETCSDLSGDSQFFWRTEGVVVTDANGLQLERDLAWVDLIEATVWLLIIVAIEMTVRLQGRGVTGGPLIAAGNAVQLFLYLLLLVAGVYWATLSHWLYLWDELVWIGGFAAIEMNVSEWRNKLLKEEDQSTGVRGVPNNRGNSRSFEPADVP